MTHLGAERLKVAAGFWIVKDFRFHTGDVLPELRLHYTALGAPTGELCWANRQE